MKKFSKKGASHVDWAISMGIFLIYLFTLFVLIKPGAKPVYTQETLLSIVEEKFEENTTWVVKKTPLFIRKCKSYVPEGSTTEKPCIIQIKENSGYWDGILFNELRNSVDSMGPTFEVPHCIGDFSITKKNYLLVLIPKSNFDFDNPDFNSVLSLELNPANNPKCDAELGVTEDIEGISEKWLNSLKSFENYENLKIDWDYPKQKDFAIYVNEEKITNSPEPYQQANVFVKEYKDWYVEEDADRVLIKINLRAW